MEIKQKFPERLKELRKDKNLTQKQLADKILYTQETVSYWENGTKEPSIQTIIDLSIILDTTTDYLLGKSGF